MTHGRLLKRVNALISTSFLIPVAILASRYHVSVRLWIVGFLSGFLWANWFEYFYHRWLDHASGTMFEKSHRKHHTRPEDDEHINLGDSPWLTVGMFAVNSIPTVALAVWTGVPFAAPAILAFVVYVLFTEEIHWRVHKGDWTPFGLGKKHLLHHSRPKTRYNIFLPVFDWLFGTL